MDGLVLVWFLCFVFVVLLVFLIGKVLVLAADKKTQAFNVLMAEQKSHFDLEESQLRQALNVLIEKTRRQENQETVLTQDMKLLRDENKNLSMQLSAAASANAHAESIAQERASLEIKCNQLQKQIYELQLGIQKSHLLKEQEQKASDEKIQLMSDAKDTLTLQFKALANQIMDEKSRAFTESNQNNMSQILAPIQEKMKEFSLLVQETYEKESKERLTLENELKRLQVMNNQLNDDAQALTRALTGKNNKTQGNWGEMILEKILESSGLRKDKEYRVQASFSRQEETGTKKLQPDVLVLLPDDKKIIIDAKVSLTAYVAYVNEQDEGRRQQYLKDHLASVRRHIKSLSDKAYHRMPEGKNLDFVLMFIPVEPAYLVALEGDAQLLQEGFEQHILLAGPSTLLAMLRTIAGVWRYEHQSQNALSIAEEGGKLYDKFVGLTESLEKVGRHLDQTQQSYQTAIKQLATGSGNLVLRAERLREMGVKHQKKISQKFLTQENMTIAPLSESIVNPLDSQELVTLSRIEDVAHSDDADGVNKLQ